MKKDQVVYYLMCNYCYWDSRDIKYVDEEKHLLLPHCLSMEIEAEYHQLLPQLMEQFNDKVVEKDEQHVGAWNWKHVERMLSEKSRLEMQPVEENDCIGDEEYEWFIKNGNADEVASLNERFASPLEQTMQKK